MNLMLQNCSLLRMPIMNPFSVSFSYDYSPISLILLLIRIVFNYAPDRWLVRRATLNGVELKDWRVKHADLVCGGELVFEMAEGNVGEATR